MRLLDRLRGESRHSVTTVDDYFNYLGHSYPMGLPGVAMSMDPLKQPAVKHSYEGFVEGILKQNVPVWSAEQIRVQVFSSIRYQFQQLDGGRPTRLFGTPELDVLDEPAGPDTVQDLAGLQLLTADFAGTCYHYRAPDRLVWLRPDWVDVVFAEREDRLGFETVGARYHPGGRQSKERPVPLLREDLAVFAPMPDPVAPWRGMSWLTPTIREVRGDNAASDHKLKFFENAATPNLAVSLKESVSAEEFAEFMSTMNEAHKGVDNAYKTLYMGGGADVTVVGADLKQLDFKATQGHGETRLSMASGVPAVILGSSEGMQGSSLNAGNYGQARRRFADGTMHPLWQKSAGSFQHVVKPPAGSRLWYDSRDVPFLREDAKDAAEIFNLQATAARTLVDGGFDPDSVVDAVDTMDVRRLDHSGNVSVQLQPAGTSSNGNGRASLPEGASSGRTD